MFTFEGGPLPERSNKEYESCTSTACHLLTWKEMFVELNSLCMSGLHDVLKYIRGLYEAILYINTYRSLMFHIFPDSFRTSNYEQKLIQMCTPGSYLLRVKSLENVGSCHHILKRISKTILFVSCSDLCDPFCVKICSDVYLLRTLFTLNT
jgi:hypothetical protein